MRLSLIIAINLLICSQLFAATLPPEFTATYEIKKGFITIGEATRSLRKSGDQWQYTSDSRTTGFLGAVFPTKIIQTTQFDITDSLIRPLHYKYTKNKTAKVVNQKYDWEQHKVYSQSDEKLHVYEIPDKVQDQSIYQLSMMLDLADGKRDFTYHVAENVRLMDYFIKALPPKTIKTFRGKMQTTVMRIKTKRNTTTIWFAPSLHYLPVKIEFEEDGTTFVALLTNLHGF